MSNHNYRLDEKEPEKINTRLLYITQSQYGNDWHSTAHSHHFTELFFITDGTGNFLIENETFPVKKNDLIIINPNVSHTESGSHNQPLEYIALGINGLQFMNTKDSPDAEFSESGCYIFNTTNFSNELLAYLKLLLKEVQNKEDNFESVSQNLLEIILWTILRRTQTQISLGSVKKVTKECRFIEQYLDEHFREDISLDDLSNLTHLNKYYLVHEFKKYTGISPISYIIQKRIQESKYLLETTNYPVSKISTLTGFSSLSYFSQVFRRETQMSPNEYRKSKLPK